MKQKPSSAKKKGTQAISDIRDAYDMKEAREECRTEGYRARSAIAWMEGGWLQHSLELDLQQAQQQQSDVASLVCKWLEPMGSIGEISKVGVPPLNINAPVCVKCLVWSTGGSGWLVWKAEDVKAAIFKTVHSAGPILSFMAIEDTIFDSMQDKAVWFRPYNSPWVDRCTQFAKHVLTLVASNAVVARSTVPGFWAAFESETYSSPYGPGERLAMLLNRCKDSATKMIRSLNLKAVMNEAPDAGTAIEQGFRLGRCLAEAESLIANEQSKALVTHSGNNRRGLMPFWAWLISDPAFEGKTASEVFPQLRGRPDPEFPNTYLRIEDDRLIRGDGEQLLESSFASKWRSLGARKKRSSAP